MKLLLPLLPDDTELQTGDIGLRIAVFGIAPSNVRSLRM